MCGEPRVAAECTCTEREFGRCSRPTVRPGSNVNDERDRAGAARTAAMSAGRPRRPMSAVARKAVSPRMKPYWAARRKAPLANEPHAPSTPWTHGPLRYLAAGRASATAPV